MSQVSSQVDITLKGMPKKNAFYMPMAALMRWGMLVMLVLISIGVWAAMMIIGEREFVVRKEVMTRAELQVEAKAEVMEAWLEGLSRVGDHIVSSDLIQLYASEAILSDNNDSVEQSLLQQLPYMQQAMTDYAEQNGLNGAFVVASDGRVLMGSREAGTVGAQYKEIIANSFEKAEVQYSTLQDNDFGLVVAVTKPILSLDDAASGQSVTALLLSEFIVGDDLKELLDLGKLSSEGERMGFYQVGTEGLELVSVDNLSDAKPVSDKIVSDHMVGVAKLSTFRPVPSLNDNKPVFASFTPVENAPFVLGYENLSDIALAPLAGFKRTIYLLTTMIVILVSAFLFVMIGHLLATRNRQRVRIQEQAMMALVKAVEIRDPYLSGHHERVARMALRVSNAMGMSIPERSTLFYSALLSGVGKIFVPQEVLTKKGKLTKTELGKLQQHIPHAMRVLEDIHFDFPVAPVIQQMYERMDGSGYPYGAEEAEINMLSRVLGACDVFCALTKPRAYREELSTHDAVELMREEQEKFDERILEMIEKLAKEG
ncbi:MAG: HD domain-containing phosphohydrolase [Pseudomonadota bacterium]|nr:HD domain-containing phosphohydrolase [Pseudomonadota bacterium]